MPSTALPAKKCHPKQSLESYAPERADLCDTVDATIEALRESGEFAKLQAAWLGTGATV
jgi:ABC-type amino acid transport substrate-binding protein